MNMGRSRGQRADVRTDEKQFGTFDHDVSFLELRAPGTDCLDFPALEHHPCLETLFDEVIVKRFLVLNNAHGRSAKFPRYAMTMWTRYSNGDGNTRFGV